MEEIFGSAVWKPYDDNLKSQIYSIRIKVINALVEYLQTFRKSVI